MNATPWYDNRLELVAFASLLNDLDAFVGDEATLDLLYLFEKPHKWNAEHAAWAAAGRPGSEHAFFERVRAGDLDVHELLCPDEVEG
jgi:hypothetical protein